MGCELSRVVNSLYLLPDDEKETEFVRMVGNDRKVNGMYREGDFGCGVVGHTHRAAAVIC
jgi:hypothetical protein